MRFSCNNISFLNFLHSTTSKTFGLYILCRKLLFCEFICTKKEAYTASLSSFSCSYFNFVAIPPLMCLSALFSSKIILTSFANSGLIFRSLSLTSLCTVDLLIEKCAEHARTVQPVATIYSAHFLALSSIYSHKIPTSV